MTEDDLFPILSAIENLRGGGSDRSNEEQVEIRWRIAEKLAALYPKLVAYIKHEQDR